jgi:hypothetical protein
MMTLTPAAWASFTSERICASSLNSSISRCRSDRYGRLAIQLKIGFVADFRFATLFAAEGEQQRNLFQQLANFAQRQQYLLRFSDL